MDDLIQSYTKPSQPNRSFCHFLYVEQGKEMTILKWNDSINEKVVNKCLVKFCRKKKNEFVCYI